jgi:hypothetical protein
VQDAAPAAKRLAADLVTDSGLQRIRQWPIEGAVLVPVHALESHGYNRIPAAFAQLLAEALGLEVETEIIQANVVNHTGASEWQRLASPPLFEGTVRPGARCLVVDDFVGQGGSLANLRGHIVRGGGCVIGAVCLTGRDDGRQLALESRTLDALRKKHGGEIEDWWRETCGYGFSALTESEGRSLLRVEDAHTIRAKLAEARSQGHG